MLSELIGLLGRSLSSLINKPLLVCKGYIRLAVYDYYPKEEIYNNRLKYYDFELMIKTCLRDRLNNLGIDNEEEVIEALLSVLNKNQAIFIMAL